MHLAEEAWMPFPTLMFVIYFEKSFFPSTVIDYNKKASDIWDSSSFNIFKNKLLRLLQPAANSMFKCHNSKGIQFLTKLRLGLIHFYQ